MMKCGSIFGLIVGALLFTLGLVIFAIFPVITRNLIRKNLPLVNGSFSFEKWSSPDYTINMDFWLYNVTNPDEILLRGAKPSLGRKGPYSFTEKQHKVDIEFNETMGDVKYRNIKTYVFNASQSCASCSKDDIFIVPNVPYLTAINAMNTMPNMSEFLKGIFHVTLLAIGEHPFTAQSVDSLLFTGYKDRLFSLLQWFKSLPQFANVPDRMGFFYPKNGSDDGWYTVDSGRDAASHVGQILDWNGLSELNIWNSQISNLIMGTDGSIFEPFLDKSAILRIYVSDICRSIYAIYHSDTSVDGLPAFRFYVPEAAFSSKNLDNEGYCQPTDQLYYPKSQVTFGNSSLYCLPGGLLNLTKCRFGAPIVVSNANFLFAPDEVAQSVVGLSPGNPENAGSFLDIEPHTGVVLNAVRRIQINVAMYKTGRILKYVTPVIIPVLFLNESAKVSQSTRDYFYDSFVKAPSIAKGIASTFIVVGVLLCFICAALLLVSRVRRQKLSDVSSIAPQHSTSTAVSLIP